MVVCAWVCACVCAFVGVCVDGRDTVAGGGTGGRVEWGEGVDYLFKITLSLAMADFMADLAAKGAHECSEVRKELEYTTEKSEIAQAKLKARYLDGLETERVDLRALKSDFTVASFRYSYHA